MCNVEGIDKDRCEQKCQPTVKDHEKYSLARKKYCFVLTDLL